VDGEHPISHLGHKNLSRTMNVKPKNNNYTRPKIRLHFSHFCFWTLSHVFLQLAVGAIRWSWDVASGRNADSRPLHEGELQTCGHQFITMESSQVGEMSTCDRRKSKKWKLCKILPGGFLARGTSGLKLLHRRALR